MSDSIGKVLKELYAKIGITEIPETSHEELTKLKVKTYNQREGNLHEIDGYNCPICKNRGHSLVIGSSGYEAYQECKCNKIRATLRRARKSGLGDILTDYTFDKFIDTEDFQTVMKTKAQKFCNDNTAQWFYIGGQSGSGKTHICTAIAAHYIKAGREVKYMIWIEESKKLKAIANDISYQEQINQYKNIDVLYIDDFFKVMYNENPTTADIKLALEIINHRLLSKDKITIISSEKTIDELIDYDEATMGRIFQKACDYKISIAKDRSRNYRLRG